MTCLLIPVETCECIWRTVLFAWHQGSYLFIQTTPSHSNRCFSVDLFVYFLFIPWQKEIYVSPHPLLVEDFAFWQALSINISVINSNTVCTGVGKFRLKSCLSVLQSTASCLCLLHGYGPFSFRFSSDSTWIQLQVNNNKKLLCKWCWSWNSHSILFWYGLLA